MSNSNWVQDNGVYKLEVNNYKITVTDNDVFVWWAVQFMDDLIQSSYSKEIPQSNTVKEAKNAAYNCYLNHYTEGDIFPDFLG